MKTTAWEGQRIVIIGAARQGCALARYLIRNGAEVILNDQRTENNLIQEMANLNHHNLKWILGGHPLDILENADLICPSGGVPLTLPILQEARNRKIPFSNDSQIFLDNVQALVVGITGSAGKTTTTSLVGLIAQKWVGPPVKAWIGGNIGNPLIDSMDEIAEQDFVILELSSFQLELMNTSPAVAAVLNITPNHLDRHGTMQAYTNAKANILRFQNSGNTAVLNRDDPGSWNLLPYVKGNLVTYGLEAASHNEIGIYSRNDQIFLNDGERQFPILPNNAIHLRGRHNLLNVLGACAIAFSAGFSIDAIREAVCEFKGAPHRLELVRSLNGISWYNDSIATAPERTIAAIQSFTEPIVLLVGGKDKDLPWDNLIALINQRVDHLIVFGNLADKIMSFYKGKRNCASPQTIDQCDRLEQAVNIAVERAQPGDIVLLAPGGTSFDEFKDFEERGTKYREWVCKLT